VHGHSLQKRINESIGCSRDVAAATRGAKVVGGVG
jgi:hypothetical protein